MDKFSSVVKNNSNKKHKEEIIFNNDDLCVLNIDGWSVVKEKDMIVCIPYLIERNEIILRYEYIPSFNYIDDQKFYVTVISGSIENNESPNITLMRELEEEAGIVLRHDFKMEHMKPLYVSKSSVNKYYPYIITLCEKDYDEVYPTGDGSMAESMSKSARINVKYLNNIQTKDLITEYMLIKFKEFYMNYSIKM